MQNPFTQPNVRCYIIILLFSFILLQGLQGVDSPASPIILQVKNREIIVNGKKSQAYQVAQSNGIQGLTLNKGGKFNVVVENLLDVPTGIHWHGLILPNDQDGVPFVTQLPIPAGGKYSYSFPLVQAGSFWMHAHYGLEEQKLLAAPLILHEPGGKNSDQQEVVMFLTDFTFQDPAVIFKELKKGSADRQSSGISGSMSMKRDLNDVKYDAFLTNWRTLSDPEIVAVVPEKELRLRVINGSSSTNFFIDLGNLKGEAIAVDGSDCIPLAGSRFEIATAQRIDIRIKIPSGSAAYPVIAQGEGLTMQTGLILAVQGGKIPMIKEKGDQAAGALAYGQEFQLKAKTSLPKKEINRRVMVNLEGDMAKYIWMINGKAWPDNEPLYVKEGERVELIFVNHTSMAHPMHLHGHVFQVIEINGTLLDGAMRDTILVLPNSTVKVQFDAVHPGNWPFHCHNLYHLYAGMMTTLNYEGYKGPVFSRAEKMEELQKQ